MRLNERFFLSREAPEYVLFNLTPIDGKFPPLEDALVLRDLLINYKPVAAEGVFLLLDWRASARPRLTLVREGTVRSGEAIGLKEWGDAAIWIEILVEPTWLGRAREFAYKSPTVRLAVWSGASEESAPARYRAPVPMLEAGFLASPLVLNNDDVRNFYTGGPVNRPPPIRWSWVPAVNASGGGRSAFASIGSKTNSRGATPCRRRRMRTRIRSPKPTRCLWSS